MQPDIKFNFATSHPHLSDLLDLLKKEVFLDLNCHHLATVQSFDSGAQTVTATINYTKTTFELDEATGLNTPIQTNYPLLVDVPVVVLGGGPSHLTFPISKGDQAIILFNDRNIDNWFASGQVGPVANSRCHAFSDGIALIGLNSLNTALSDYDNARALLSNGTTGIGVGATQVKIYNAVNGMLGANFTAFFSALTTFMTAVGSATSAPQIAAAAAAFISAMSVPVAPSSLGPISNIEGILE